MLTDADRLLLAAAAGGDPLTADQAAALARLLAGSAAARRLHDRLAADRRAVGGLPLLAAPSGFAGRVADRLVIVRPAVPARRGRGADWLPYVTAAVVLLAAGGVYLASRDRAGPPPVAKVADPLQPPPAKSEPTRPAMEPDPGPVAPPPAVAVETRPAAPELAPAPRVVEPPAVAAAGLLNRVPLPEEGLARLPVLSPVTALDAPAIQEQLLAELSHHPVARLDLFCADPARVVPVLRAAAEAVGLRVRTEPTAADRLKAKMPVGYAFYTEALTPAEAGKLLANLAGRQRGEAGAATAHLSAAGAAETRELKELFGEPRKPAADKPAATIDQVMRRVNGPAPARPAILFAPDRPQAGSKELRAFADARGPRKPEAVPLLVVVRPSDAAE